LIGGKREADYFSRADWTTKIGLKKHAKFAFARGSFHGLIAVAQGGGACKSR
jgi:hypothetical protein